MNPYLTTGSGSRTPEADALSARLKAWHDAIETHERKIRAGRVDEVCDEECPHAEALPLWVEALEMFGDRVKELTFLRSRALAASKRRSKSFVCSERLRAAMAEL
jgi:hypothetical protein